MRSEIEVKQLLKQRIESKILALENNLSEKAFIYSLIIDEIKWILNDNTNEHNK